VEREGLPPLETMVREYKRTRDYERDARQRRKEGWRVVSVLQRPALPGRARRAAMGVGMVRGETEYLVTYNRAAGTGPRQRPLAWLWEARLARGASRPWLWAALAAVLLALLAYGFFDFFAGDLPL
jgi:hypothetical protein